MPTITVSKRFYTEVALPGMGRSIDLIGQSATDVASLRQAFQARDLYVQFVEEPETSYPVIQLWASPHGDQVTLFI